MDLLRASAAEILDLQLPLRKKGRRQKVRPIWGEKECDKFVTVRDFVIWSSDFSTDAKKFIEIVRLGGITKISLNLIAHPGDRFQTLYFGDQKLLKLIVETHQIVQTLKLEKDATAIQKHARAQREYRARNPEQVAQSQREYRARNPEQVAQSQSEYVARNPEQVSQTRSDHAARNPEQVSQSRSDYEARNPEQRAQSRRDYAARNPEQVSQSRSDYAARNPERVSQSSQDFNVRSPGSHAQHQRDYRARQEEKRMERDDEENAEPVSQFDNMSSEDIFKHINARGPDGSLSPLETAEKAFTDEMAILPDRVCVSCERMFFPKQGSVIKDDGEWAKVEELCKPGDYLPTRTTDPEHWRFVCRTCIPWIRRGEVPKLSMERGLRLRPVKEFEDIRPIEARFLQVVNPFQTVIALGAGNRPNGPQTAAKGHTICFQADTASVLRQLPAISDEELDIVIVRPALPRDVAQANSRSAAAASSSSNVPASHNAPQNGNTFDDPLRSTSSSSSAAPGPSRRAPENRGDPEVEYEIVKDLSVTRNLARLNTIHQCAKFLEKENVLMQELVTFRDCTSPEITSLFDGDQLDLAQEPDANQVFSELDAPPPRDVNLDEYLHAPADHGHSVPRDAFRVVRLERNEGEIVRDQALISDCMEALAFPELFPRGRNHYGTERAIPLTMLEYMDLRLRHYSRRFSRNHRWLFFWKMMLDKHHISQENSMSVKRSLPSRRGDQGVQDARSRARGAQDAGVEPMQVPTFDYRANANVDPVTRADMEQQSAAGASDKVADDFEISSMNWMSSLKGTQAWKNVHHRQMLSAMRHAGTAAGLLTISANDVNSPELFVFLTQNDEKWTRDEVPKKTSAERERVLHRDQFLAAFWFERRMNAFLKHILLNKDCPVLLREVTHYYAMTEFQGRGSPHWHILIWLKNWYDLDEVSEQIACVNEYMKHLFTCKADRGDDSPRGKMLRQALKYNHHAHGKHCASTKHPCKSRFPRPPAAEFEHVTYGERKRRSMREADFCLYPRSGEYERNQNPVVKTLIILDTNVDYQPVESAYGVVMYVCGYISKGECVGMVAGVRKALEKLPPGTSARTRRFVQAKTVLTHRVQSVQEIGYHLLPKFLKLSHTDMKFVSIQALPSSHCKRLLKKKEQLERLDFDSSDIWVDNVTERYARRPVGDEFKLDPEVQQVTGASTFEDLCLVDFASWYQIGTKGARIPCQARNGKVTYIAKRKEKAVASVAFLSDRKWFDLAYFGMMKLFFPWRNEIDLLGNNLSAKAAFLSKGDELELMMLRNKEFQRYNSIRELINEDPPSNEEMFLEALEVYAPAIARSIRDRLAVNDLDEDSMADDDVLAPRAGFAQAELDAIESWNVFQETNLRLAAEEDRPPLVEEVEQKDCGLRLLSDSELRAALISISKLPSQSRALVEILEAARGILDLIQDGTFRSSDCICKFLTGGAGAGKTFVLRVLMRLLNDMFGCLQAFCPTGCAACNLGARTIHDSVDMPVFSSNRYRWKPLFNSYKKPVIMARWKGVIVVVIDEISMVSSNMLLMIERRLQELSTQWNGQGGCRFGDVALIIGCGDMCQLRPIKAPWIFERVHKPVLSMLQLTADPWLWGSFQLVEIEGSQRQVDSIYLQFLNWLRWKRKGEDLDPRFADMVNSRRPMTISAEGGLPITVANSDRFTESTHLFATNDEVDSWNDFAMKAVAQRRGKPVLTIASTHRWNRGPKGCDQKLLGTLLSQSDVKRVFAVKDDIRKGSGLSRTLRILEGTGRWMVTRNIDLQRGLANGALVNEVSIDGAPGGIVTGLCCVLEQTGKPVTLAPLTALVKGDNDKFRWWMIERAGLAIRAAWALTIDKCQGLTLLLGVIDLASAFTAQHAYVAFSRFPDEKSIVIKRVNWRSMYLPDDVRAEIYRLRAASNSVVMKERYPDTAPFLEIIINLAQCQKLFDAANDDDATSMEWETSDLQEAPPLPSNPPPDPAAAIGEAQSMAGISDLLDQPQQPRPAMPPAPAVQFDGNLDDDGWSEPVNDPMDVNSEDEGKHDGSGDDTLQGDAPECLLGHRRPRSPGNDPRIAALKSQIPDGAPSKMDAETYALYQRLTAEIAELEQAAPQRRRLG